jgi:hypothetical protein
MSGFTMVTLLFLPSCAPLLPMQTEPVFAPSSAEATPESFTVVTWNVWHGLNTGEFWVTPAESPEENHARLQHQVAQLAAERPDVIFLQEVNPLPERALAYVEGLKAKGLPAGASGGCLRDTPPRRSRLDPRSQ